MQFGNRAAFERKPRARFSGSKNGIACKAHGPAVTRYFRGHLSVRLRHRKETLPVSEPYMHLFKQM